MLDLDAVSVQLGDRMVLRDITLEADEGSTVALLGPSGCGKTTMLRAIAGLQPIDGGSIRVGGTDLDGVPPHQRNVGLMFQDYALFPHRDVYGNVEFGLRMRHIAPDARRRRVDEVLDLVGLGGFEHRSVSELSGGERQRVALARSLAPEPQILMLDEPLASLDRTLRDQLVLDLRALFASEGLTVVYVTHDQAEALALADEVVIIDDGRIAQQARPAELWARPASPFVARFLGFSNLFDVDVCAGRVHTAFGPIDDAKPDWADGVATALVRPTAVRLCENGGAIATVRSCVFAGDHTIVELATADGTVVEASVRGGVPAVGSTIGFDVDPAGVQLFAPTAAVENGTVGAQPPE